MQTRSCFPVPGVLFGSLATALLSGCSANFIPNAVTPERVPIGNIQGSVHGGQAPISGGHIYLYAASTSGYGTNAISLIDSSGSNVSEDGDGNYYVTTNADGSFTLDGDYTCTQGQQVYMVAVGGNAGFSGTVNNTGIVQMAALGQCPAAGNLAAQVPYLVINEVTTAAFAYSVGGFATTAYNVSTDATGATALANAFLNAGNIVNLESDQAPASYVGGGMNQPYKLAVDATNNVLVANSGTNTVSAWSQTAQNWLAPNGFTTGAPSSTGAVVIGVDRSGNVWTGNADGSVTQLLSLATPAATPFYSGMAKISGTGRTRPQPSPKDLSSRP